MESKTAASRPATYYKYCIVPMCKNTTVTTPNKLFICLPPDKHRRILWQKAMRRDNLVSFKGAKFCCEDHFDLQEDMENYVRYKLMKNVKVKLKSNVVPHKFECQNKKWTQSQPKRSAFLKRQHQQVVTEAVEKTQSPKKPKTNNDILMAEGSLKNSGDNPKTSLCDIKCKNVAVQQETQRAHKQVQVNIKPQVRSKQIQCKMEQNLQSLTTNKIMVSKFSNSSTSNSSTTSFTASTKGTTSDFSADTEITEDWNYKSNVTKRCEYVISQNPKLYLGIPSHSYFMIENLCSSAKLTKVEIFVTLKKIRLNLPYSVLADDFAISTATVCLIIQKAIPRLATILRRIIQWKKLIDIQKCLPIQFRLRFRKVQAIIDCFEIQIQKPNNPILQSFSWSEYKKCNTMKYLIACTPDGLITFMSKGFGGRATDQMIVQESGFLSLLEPHAHVMADRGFKNIDELLCRQNNVLVKPPSVTANMKCTQAEVRAAKKVASVRIHVERVISRIREFRIVEPHATLNLNLIKYLDDILLIIGALVNLQNYLIH